MANKKLTEKYEQFQLWPEWEVEYGKINENISFRIYVRDDGLEEYTLLKHMPPWNEIVQEFYTQLQPATWILNSQGKGGTIYERRILRALHLQDVPKEEPKLTDRPKEIQSGSQRFQEFAPISTITTSMKVIWRWDTSWSRTFWWAFLKNTP